MATAMSDPSESIPNTAKPEVKKAGSMEEAKTNSSNNLIIVTGSRKEFPNGESESEHYDSLHFENVRDFDSMEEKCCAAEGMKLKGRFMTFLTSIFNIALLWCIVAVLSFGLVFLAYCISENAKYISTETILTVVCMVIICAFARKHGRSSIISSRTIKWTLDKSEEIMGYFFTSPTIQDHSGSWRLVLSQLSENEADFGLIATEICERFEHVMATVEISINIGGRNTVSAMTDVIKFVQKFECEGDCGYSGPISLNFEQLKNHNLEIKCRIQFKRVKFVKYSTKLLKSILDPPPIKYRIMDRSQNLNSTKTQTPGTGTIRSDTTFRSKMEVERLPKMLTGTELEGDSLSFMKHPQTKVFVWKIPNFSKHLKNVEFWEILSPKLLVGSHGFCSIWRLQLVELEGVFRMHVELRGLPRGISEIKMRYLMELMDNTGEFVAPNNCGSTIKYPEHLKLYGTSGSAPLYRRETILERFLDKDDALNLRISLHCEPKESLDFGRRNACLHQRAENFLRTLI